MKISVVGAGLAGLAAGTWLKQSGYKVEIFEASPRAGGRAQTIQKPGTDDLVDVGTQYFHSNYRRALSLIRSAGLQSDLTKIKGKTRFFDERVSNGSFTTGHRLPYIASGSLLANLRMNLKGALRLARNWIDPYAVLQNSPIDRLTAREFFKDSFEWEFSARALIAAGALVEPEHEAVSFLHVIRLMRIIVLTDYLTLNGGIASLHERLAQDLDIEYEAAATRILEDQSGTCGLILEDGRKIACDHLIIATPPAAGAGILPKHWEKERRFLSSIKQPPAIVVTLFLDRPLEDKVWSYVFRPDPDRRVSFCVDAAQKNPVMVNSGNGILQAWVCHPASGHLMDASDQEVVNSVTEELSVHFDDLSERTVHAHVHKVPQAIPQMEIGHNKKATEFLELIDQRAGIDFCGDYLSGGYMECALWSAERAVNRINNHSNANP